MRPKSLREARDFRSVFKSGKRLESPLFRIMVRPNKLSLSRWAYVAPKALDKRASLRNRLRRRAREWVRKHSEAPSIAQDTVIIFKKQALEATKKLFYEELAKIVRKTY